MKIVDYGGNGMCGPRVLLRTRDENLARKHLKEIIDYNIANFKTISEKIKLSSSIESVIEAYQSIEHFKIFLTDNNSTSMLLAYAASPFREESYIVHYGGVLINVDVFDYPVRHLKATGSHWQELI